MVLVTPEELAARARRAYQAFHSDGAGGHVQPWASLDSDAQRPWIAAASAAVSYRPPSERARSTQSANRMLKIAQAHALLGEAIEEP